MVESLKELNKICQKPDYKKRGNWMVRHILRDAALPVTWLLLHTGVTANQVTLVSMLVGVFGIAFFSVASPFAYFVGALLMQLWYYLDHVDGQIARYRKNVTLSGRFFDFITHHLIHGIILFSFGLYAFYLTDQVIMLVLGFIGSMGIMMFNLVQDAKSKTFCEGLTLKDSFRVDEKTFSPDSNAVFSIIDTALNRKIFSLLHKSIEIHVMMNLILLFSTLEFIFRWDLKSRLWMLFFYGLVGPVLAIGKSTYMIVKRMVDKEFIDHFGSGGREGV